MSIVHDNEKNQSKLLIIDSDNFSDKAVAEILMPQEFLSEPMEVG